MFAEIVQNSAKAKILMSRPKQTLYYFAYSKPDYVLRECLSRERETGHVQFKLLENTSSLAGPT